MRTRAEVLDRDAEVAFRAACEQLDLTLVRVPDTGRSSIEVGGRHLPLAVHGATIVTLDRVGTLTERPTPDGVVPVLVADKVLGDAGRALDAAGWGWLDRRGRLHLRSGGTLIDVDIDPTPRGTPRRRPSDALAARGAQELAVALLLGSDDPPGVRAIARAGGFAPSTISRALAELRDLGLVHADGRPVVPDLFWALADRWAPQWVALSARLDPTDPQLAVDGLSTADLDRPGAAVGDTRAALAWGAPVVASADGALSLYVPDHAVFDRIVELVGTAAHPVGGEDRIAVAPVPSVLTRRFTRPGEPWPVVHPIIAALDLATDRARGHQILDEWDPEDGARAW